MPDKLVKEVLGGTNQGDDGTRKAETRKASGLRNCSVVTAGVRATPRSWAGAAGREGSREHRRGETGQAGMRSRENVLQSGRGLGMFKAKGTHGYNLLLLGIKCLGTFNVS